MTLLHHTNLIMVERELEQGNHLLFHELRGDRAAAEPGEPLFDELDTGADVDAAEPDADPEPEDLPEDDAAALAALAAMDELPPESATQPAAAPVVQVAPIHAPADPTGGDPYHEAGEAFRRLKAGEQLGAVAGEQLGTVADDLGLPMPKLRSRWARYQQALQLAGWQPGATVATAPERPLDDDWCACARCRTRFNAGKAQAAAKLPQRPTLCAICRSR